MMIISVKGWAKPSKDLIESFPKFKNIKKVRIDKLQICMATGHKLFYVRVRVGNFRQKVYYDINWFSKISWEVI